MFFFFADFEGRLKHFTDDGIYQTVDNKLDVLRLLMRSFAASNFGDTLMVNNNLMKIDFQKRCKSAISFMLTKRGEWE